MEIANSDLAIVAALIAGFIGTGAMTLSSASEAAWTQRGDSSAPAVAVLWPLKKLFGLNVEGRALFTIAVSAHWAIGIGWGIVWWLLISVAELNLAVTTGLFFLIVWVSAILLLKLTGIAPWPWTWGIKYNIFDWTHHSAYVGGVALAWILIERIAVQAA